MRIIAGTARGRRLVAPAGDRTRPMLDLQKESLFNIIQGSLPTAGVLDIFAGSGALGLEAMSRGAVRATFVERARPAAEVIRRNLAICGFGERGSVLVLDAFRFDPSRLDHEVGLVFLDPPFPLVRESPPAILDLLERVARLAPLEADPLFMLRIPSDLPSPDFPAGLVVHDRRESGESVLFLIRPAARAG